MDFLGTRAPILGDIGFHMPSAALIWSLLGLVLLATAVRRLLRWRRLSHVPGPMISGWTSLWLAKRSLKRELFFDVRRLTAKYGAFLICATTYAEIFPVQFMS
jgi:hypothetical protein